MRQNRKGRFSGDRKICPDIEVVHKKRIYNSTNNKFLKLDDLAFLLQPLFPLKDIRSDDYVCKNCYTRFTSRFSVPSNVSIISEVDDDNVICEPEILGQNPMFEPDINTQLEELNENAFTLGLDVSPLRKISLDMAQNEREKYACRKRKEIFDSFSEATEKKLSKCYNVTLPKSNESSLCEQWVINLRLALENCKSISEKIRLLTILPKDLSKSQILLKFPSITKYMIDEARKLKKNKGIYYLPDPYSGHPVSDEHVKLAQEYFINDDLDCSRQSPNKNDVINAEINGEKVKVVKRFLTRSIREIYHIFRDANPDVSTHIGRSKFYTLRPRWVMIDPHKEVCVCIYCANFDLCLIALRNLRGNRFLDLREIRKELFSYIMCSPSTEQCVLQECDQCPGAAGITTRVLNISEETAAQDVTFALWNKADLEKRTTSIETFLSELTDCTLKANVHKYIKDIQREEIKSVKEQAKLNSEKLVLHGDFAENWKKIIRDEIQSAYWTSEQISIFTAVCYSGTETQSFAVVSDDTKHDSAYALLAMDRILEIFKEKVLSKSIKEITIITDGAPAHFKNRFQFYELTQSPVHKSWIFSATGHGKGACDGIGGIVKHLATAHNLKKSQLEGIDSAETFVSEVQKYTSSIKLIFLASGDLQKFRKKKFSEWKNVPTVAGIQKCHVWKSEFDENRDRSSYMSRTAKHIWQKVE